MRKHSISISVSRDAGHPGIRRRLGRDRHYRCLSRKLIITALWTEACLTFPALDAIQEGYEVYVPVDAVGGTSLAAHEAALRRVEQAGAKLISRVQMYCELQRDWTREATVPGFMDVFESFDGFNPEKAAAA